MQAMQEEETADFDDAELQQALLAAAGVATSAVKEERDL